MIKIASLFSGIGGFEIGIQQAADKLNIDIEYVFASENNKYARQIYRKNFRVEPYGDITKIKATDVPEHDILCGGFPCQDVSIAGKREGLYGARTGLFYKIIRILRKKQPELVFLENVEGLLSSNGGWDFARVLIELEDAGYSCEWQVLNTKAFLPQTRKRVFIIGHLTGSERSGRKIFPIGQSGKVDSEKEPTVYTIDANYYKGPAKQQRTMILCDSGIHRETQLRNETIPPLRANTGAGHNNIVCHSTFPRNSVSGLGGTGHLSRGDGLVYCCDAANNIAIEVPGIVKCITGGGHSGGNHSDMTVLKTSNNLRRLTPKEIERLQGFPDGWTSEGLDNDGNIVKISDTQRYKTCGNAVSVPVIEFISERLLKIL